jgi:peptide/nickel transport system substrate-binding protein
MAMKRHLLLAGAAVLLAPMATALAVPPEDTIVVGISADVNTFDPAPISSRDNSNIAKHIFGTLYEITPDGDIVPDLAESYEVSEDGTSYTYTLREGLTCEDGEALTAEDAAYSFNRAADPENAFTGNTPGFVFSSIQLKRFPNWKSGSIWDGPIRYRSVSSPKYSSTAWTLMKP